jgi:hypothetical protein
MPSSAVQVDTVTKAPESEAAEAKTVQGEEGDAEPSPAGPEDVSKDEQAQEPAADKDDAAVGDKRPNEESGKEAKKSKSAGCDKEEEATSEGAGGN